MIPTRRIFEICLFIAVTIVAAMAFRAWLASHDDQLRLQATLATQKQQLDAAIDRERDRAATLNQTLAQIEKLKRETQTPQQILRDLPQYLKLPQPITLNSSANISQADEQLQKHNGKGTNAAGHSEGTGRPASAAEVSPASTPSRSILGAIKEVLQKKANRNPTAVNDETLPDAANRSTSVSSAAIQATPTSTSSPSRLLHAITESLHGNATRQPMSGGNSPDAASQNARASSGPIQTGTAPSPTSAAPPSEVVPDADGRSASDSPSFIRSANAPLTEPAATQAQAARASLASPSTTTAEIPAADLKPLYDYVQDCRACQAQLVAAKQNQTDDAAKLQAMTRERDAAITAAKGGTFWRRLRRNAEWFAIGAATAAAGAVVIAGGIDAHARDHHRANRTFPMSLHLTSGNDYYVTRGGRCMTDGFGIWV